MLIAKIKFCQGIKQDQSFWDALTKHRTDGALVRLITPVYESEELKDADARLQGFAREVVPLLSEFIPE